MVFSLSSSIVSDVELIDYKNMLQIYDGFSTKNNSIFPYPEKITILALITVINPPSQRKNKSNNYQSIE
jgi:hypothetical protein